MLRAKFPTQQELNGLYRDVEMLRKDKKLKDDTIKFLQKEKEALQHQLQNYEQLLEGGAHEVLSERESQLEMENKQLLADMEHLKDVIRRQNMLLRNAGRSASSNLDRSMVKRVTANLCDLLGDVRTPMSGQVRADLEHQRDTIDKINGDKRAETAWHLLEIVDRAMLELKAVQKRPGDLPDLRSSVAKYAPTTSITASTIRDSDPSDKRGSNLLSTSSMSLANLNTESGQYVRKRTANRFSGRAGGARLERSVSAPSLNGFVPRPPPGPSPSQVITATHRGK